MQTEQNVVCQTARTNFWLAGEKCTLITHSAIMICREKYFMFQCFKQRPSAPSSSV